MRVYGSIYETSNNVCISGGTRESKMGEKHIFYYPAFRIFEFSSMPMHHLLVFFFLTKNTFKFLYKFSQI